MSCSVNNGYHNDVTISVIVPSFNYAHYLKAALNSVLQQTFIDWECIIVDDGSTDNTKSVAEEFCNRDTRFKYIYQKNNGLSSARNNGLSQAKGKFIQLLDSDDLITPDKFKNQLECFKSYPDCDIVYSGYQLMDAEANNFLSVDDTNWITMKHSPFIEFLNYWEKGFTIPIHCYLIKKSCFVKWGGFEITLPTHEDLSLHLNFSLNGVRYFMLNEKNAYYRVHNKSMARDYTNMHRGYLLALIIVLSHPKIDFIKSLLVINRYFQEFLNTLLDTMRGKKNNFFKAVNNKNSLILNSFAVIFLPFYIINKIISKVF